MFPSPVHLCQRQPESDGAEQPAIRNQSGTSPKLSAVSRQHHFWPTWPLFRRPRDGLSHGPNTSSYHRVARRQQHNKSCNPLVVSPTLQGHNVCAHERRGRRPSPIGHLLLDWAPLINADLRCALRTGLGRRAQQAGKSSASWQPWPIMIPAARLGHVESEPVSPCPAEAAPRPTFVFMSGDRCEQVFDAGEA